jgi:hypothetical protein
MDESLPEEFIREEIVTALGEPLSQVLDMSTWSDGTDLAALYHSLRQVVADSVEQERRTRNPIRELVLARLGAGTDRYAPSSAGLYRVTPEEVAELHSGLLFNGAVECCDGTIAAHDSLLLAVIQIGISLVAYQGTQGTWVQRFYRRDLHARYPDPVQEALALLERRSRPDGDEAAGQPMSRLFGRALMEYAERAALLDLSEKPWRIGHGNPVALNMLMPTTPDLLRAGLTVLQRLILDHKRFLYVASEPADRLLLTLGDALEPLEFAVVETLTAQFPDGRLERLAETQKGHKAEVALIQRFLKEIRTEVVRGVYRAGPHAPARVFYAHKDFACEAAALAIADSVLQPHRGFPMLIDLADLVCRNTFDGGSFGATVQDAYAAAGEPLRYMGERETRS